MVASLLALDSLDDQEEIKLYINCPQVGLPPLFSDAAPSCLAGGQPCCLVLRAPHCHPLRCHPTRTPSAAARCCSPACVATCALQGNPYAVTSILDTIRAIKAPVSTVGMGMVGGTAAAVLAGGAKVR